MTFRNQEAFYSVGITAIVGVGTGLITFGLANIYSAIDNTVTSVLIGVVALVAGFLFFGWGLYSSKNRFGRIALPKDVIFSFQPARNDNFSVVIEGTGSCGNPENQTNADTIARKATQELINNGATIRIARFYSRNGSQNLLAD